MRSTRRQGVSDGNIDVVDDGEDVGNDDGLSEGEIVGVDNGEEVGKMLVKLTAMQKDQRMER